MYKYYCQLSYHSIYYIYTLLRLRGGEVADEGSRKMKWEGERRKWFKADRPNSLNFSVLHGTGFTAS